MMRLCFECMEHYDERQSEECPHDEVSYRDVEARSCGHKRKLESAEEARRVAKTMHRKHKRRYNTYLCTFCGFWHIGSQRSREAALRREDRLFPGRIR